VKKSSFYLFMIVSFSILLTARFSIAAEHPGQSVTPGKSVIEHPGKSVEEQKGGEHPGKAVTADFVKESIRQHVKVQSKAGVFAIRDEKLNKEWRLKLLKVHDPVRSFEKEGQTIYFACSDFESVDSKDVLDIDFWMVPKGDRLEVIDTKIHKVNGVPRYNYEGTAIKEIK
jgi:hypothetical protein